MFASNDCYTKGETVFITEVSCGDKHTSAITSRITMRFL